MTHYANVAVEAKSRLRRRSVIYLLIRETRAGGTVEWQNGEGENGARPSKLATCELRLAMQLMRRQDYFTQYGYRGMHPESYVAT